MSDERRARVQQTIRLAARYIERKGQGKPVIWAPKAILWRLGADGQPVGDGYEFGPVITSEGRL